MTWKHLTYGNQNYFVNLTEVAYLQQYEGVTAVVFSARSDSGQMSITVDQTPHQILADEPIN